MKLNTRNYKIMFLLLISVGFSLSFTLQHSFAFRLGDADPMINNMWLEPNDPKPGDPVSINLSVYNLGTDSTNSVTDVVSVGYFINGQLVKVDELPDVSPGIDNGVKVTTGPIWDATDGVHTITAILNYHDSLSHLTDNLENNIMQKKYSLGDWKNAESLVSFELSQKYIPNTQKQIVTIKGTLDIPEHHPIHRTPRIDIEFTDETNSIQKHSSIVDIKNGSFYWRDVLPIYDTVIPITASFSDDRYSSQLQYSSTSNLYPIILKTDESLFTLKLDDVISFNPANQNFTIVVYDEFYQTIKKVDTDQISSYQISKNKFIPTLNPIFSTDPTGDRLYVILPGGHMYHFEIYSEEQLEYSTIKFLEKNKVVDNVIKESKETYPVLLSDMESLLSFQLSDMTNSHTFDASQFTFVIFQDSYDNLFKKISPSEYDKLNFIYDDDFLIILPANHNYIVEVYLDGEFLTASETFLANQDVKIKNIEILEDEKIILDPVDELGGVN